MSVSVFGRIVTGYQVEQAVAETLKLYFPIYLREMEHQTGRSVNVLQAPRSYKHLNRVENWPDDHLPGAIVISPGMPARPVRTGEGDYRAHWSIGVGLVVAGQDAESTNELVKIYTAASRAIILQHQSLGGFADGVEWLTESYEDAEPDGSRTIGVGQNVFAVRVDGVVDALAGPSSPEVVIDEGEWSTPETSWEITEAEVEVTKEDIE